MADVSREQFPLSQSELFCDIAEKTGLSDRDVRGVFKHFGTLLEHHSESGKATSLSLPGLGRVLIVRRLNRGLVNHLGNFAKRI